jgi:hypothetical protein
MLCPFTIVINVFSSSPRMRAVNNQTLTLHCVGVFFCLRQVHARFCRNLIEINRKLRLNLNESREKSS